MNPLEHFTISGDRVLPKTFESSESKIILTTNKVELKKEVKSFLAIPAGAAVIGKIVLKDIVIPLFIKYLPSLIYNAKNFIKEHRAVYSFLEGGLSTSVLNDIETIGYSKKVHENKSGKGVNAIEVTFDHGQLKIDNDEKNTMSYLKISALNLNYTNAKLNSSKERINLNIEVSFHYINEKFEHKTITLDPYFINDIIPDENSNIDTFDGEKTRLLPKMHIVTGIEIKITEINSNKKHMDKWLELYDEHSGKLQSALLKALKKEE